MRKLPVVPICRSAATLSKDPNQQHICAVPLSKKGALRDRHERRKRDAMDASGVARRTIVLASAKPCRSDVPRLTSSLRSHPQTTETTKSGLREERGISRQTIARSAGSFRRTCGDLLVCYSSSHARLRVRRAPGIPCALSVIEGRGSCKTRAPSSRGNAESCHRSRCENGCLKL